MRITTTAKTTTAKTTTAKTTTAKTTTAKTTTAIRRESNPESAEYLAGWHQFDWDREAE
jgi:hypothetical protein